MTMIRAFLLVISALVVGAFFTVLTVQRTRQIGLLKAMGATNGYIVRDSVGQMTVLVAAATAVGVAIGAGVIAVLGGGEAPVELAPGSIATVRGAAGPQRGGGQPRSDPPHHPGGARHRPRSRAVTATVPLECRGLVVTFPDGPDRRTILDPLDLDVARGELSRSLATRGRASPPS